MVSSLYEKSLYYDVFLTNLEIVFSEGKIFSFHFLMIKPQAVFNR